MWKYYQTKGNSRDLPPELSKYESVNRSRAFRRPETCSVHNGTTQKSFGDEKWTARALLWALSEARRAPVTQFRTIERSTAFTEPPTPFFSPFLRAQCSFLIVTFLATGQQSSIFLIGLTLHRISQLWSTPRIKISEAQVEFEVRRLKVRRASKLSDEKAAGKHGSGSVYAHSIWCLC